MGNRKMNNMAANIAADLPVDIRERDKLLADLIPQIRDGIAEHVQILQAAWEKGKPYAVKVGLLLIQAKELVKAQGLNWIPWVEANCCDERAAQRYMRLAANKDDPRLIAAEEDAKAHGRALSIEDADKALRKATKAKPAPKPIGREGERDVDTNLKDKPADKGNAEPHAEPESDEDEDGEDDQIDHATAKFDAALATILDWVADDPFEALLGVIEALGLKMADVVAWAQRQAEWEADGDEPIEDIATPPAPVVADKSVDCREKAKAATTTEAVSDHDGSSQAKNMPPVALKPAAEENGDRGKRGEGHDLTSMVVMALKDGGGGLDLPALVAKVLNFGITTQSNNLGMAIYNVLAWLTILGKVTRDDSAKTYSLVEGADLSNLEQELATHREVAATAKEAAAKVAEEERKQRDKLLKDFAESQKRAKAEKRLKSLQAVTEAIPQATDLLTTAYASIAALSTADRTNLYDVADKMYAAADGVAITLDLDYRKGFTPDVGQSTSPDGCHDLLAKAEKLLVQADSRLRSIKATDAECKNLQDAGQKMFDVACAIARAVGVD